MRPLLFIFILLTSSIHAQEFCDYDAHIAYDIGFNSADEPIEMLIQDDGKLIAVSSTYYGGSNHFEASLIRLNPNLTIDESFGVNGRIGHTWEQRNTVLCAALSEDGKIYVGGIQAPGNGIGSFNAYVARLNSDGTADSTFASTGSKKFDFKSSIVGIEPLLNGGVKVAVITSNPNGTGVIKLTEAGEPVIYLYSEILFRPYSYLNRYFHGHANQCDHPWP